MDWNQKLIELYYWALFENETEYFADFIIYVNGQVTFINDNIYPDKYQDFIRIKNDHIIIKAMKDILNISNNLTSNLTKYEETVGKNNFITIVRLHYIKNNMNTPYNIQFLITKNEALDIYEPITKNDQKTKKLKSILDTTLSYYINCLQTRINILKDINDDPNKHSYEDSNEDSNEDENENEYESEDENEDEIKGVKDVKIQINEDLNEDENEDLNEELSEKVEIKGVKDVKIEINEGISEELSENFVVKGFALEKVKDETMYNVDKCVYDTISGHRYVNNELIFNVKRYRVPNLELSNVKKYGVSMKINLELTNTKRYGVPMHCVWIINRELMFNVERYSVPMRLYLY